MIMKPDNLLSSKDTNISSDSNREYYIVIYTNSYGEKDKWIMYGTKDEVIKSMTDYNVELSHIITIKPMNNGNN